MTRTRLLAVGILVILSGAACGDDDDSDTSAAPGGAPRGDETTVNVDDNVFEPEQVEVEVDGTVTWEWIGDNPHNVVADDFESEIQMEGSFDHTFDTAGTYDYRCTVHPGMDGTVRVTG